MRKPFLILGIILLIGIFLSCFVVADYSRSNVQYFQYEENSTQTFDESLCSTGQDFLVQVSPLECTPTVVRSDLLEEQNVPVHCKLSATQINPLIDVSAIKSISFQGEYPPEVAGIGFHPARSALNVEEEIDSPLINNLGYVVILLKEQEGEASMPDFVQGNLTAKLNYDADSAFGFGKASFYLPELSKTEWENKFNQYSFWKGKAYIRAEGIDEEGATISILDSSLNKVMSSTLRVGESSEKIYMPGFDCLAGLEVKLDDVENPKTRVKLRLNGDVIEVPKEGKFLENKCRVEGWEKQGLSEKVSVACQEDEGVSGFDLEIKPKLKIKIGEVEEGYEVGDILYEFNDGSDKRIFLGYFGETADGRQFVVPVVSKEHTTEDFVASIIYQHLGKFVNSVLYETGIGVVDVYKDLSVGLFGSSTIVVNALATGSYPLKMYARGSEGSVLFDFTTIFAKAIDSNLKIPSIEFLGFTIPENKKLDAQTENYYQKAINDYDFILENFDTEKYSDKKNYGKKVLEQKIMLAGDLEQNEDVMNLCEEFKEKYSAFTEDLIDYCEIEYKLSSSEKASVEVLINKELKKITFEGIYEPSLQEFSAKVFIKGIDKDYTRLTTLQKNEQVYVSGDEFIVLKELKDGSAIFDVRNVNESVGKQLTYSPNNLEVELKDYKIFGANKYQIRVDDINLKKTALVSINPKVDNSSEVNFGFKIGIEKRSIELSPEKIKETIANLEDTISKWTSLSENLGKTVEGFKTACLATGAVLTAKNFISGIGGKSIARQEVMRGAGGWYERCIDFVAVGEYETIEQCLHKKGDEIDKEVNLWYETIQEQNEDIKKLQEGITEKKFLLGKVVDDEKFMERYAPQVQEYLESSFDEDINDPDGKAGSIGINTAFELLSYENWEVGNYNINQIRDVELYVKILEEDSENDIAKKGLYESLAEIQNVVKERTVRATLSDYLTEQGLEGVNIRPFANENTKVEVYDGAFVGSGNFGGMEQGTPIQVVTYKSGQFVLELSPLGNNQYQIEHVYNPDGQISGWEEEVKNLYSYFQKYDRSFYENEFKSSAGETEPIIKYYETEPYKGLPAMVPFDLENGWYAATKTTLPIFGNIRAYDESGRVSSFWLCNVGANGLEEFNGIGDDVCEMVNLGTGQPYNQFSGLSEDEAIERVKAGVKAIEQASKQYRAGVSKVKISVGYGSINVKVGSPAVEVPDMQCQDFMSPKDCQLLFNVCDPVICPSSRCDLGGAYPVKDVIQSGIIGSIALCLPNFKEGIYVPVCLSGINAGVEGMVSILDSYQSCLQESLETGEMVGVCDEIYSVYMCEFLWRQTVPLAKIALPKLVEAVLGQTAHGGGEYLGVQSAWSNAEKSVNYFTQYYGENSYNAFKSRTAEEAGGEICKMYVSGVYPTGGDLVDTLVEPDSPPQFHARFDEIPFTSVTSPPTSHYKVFYHIYAGKDSGAYYRVYLKGVTDSSFYQDGSSARTVASGYIGKGDYSSNTEDFTASTGYKQLCVVVNNQEPECGFQQVSTDFAVNYVEDKYIEEQSTRTRITTESECVAGSASLFSLATPNLESVADELINPEIYNRGIIRVCATDNPGKGTDAYFGGENSRWVEVGYCGEESVKCWIDRESVKNVIENIDIETGVVEELSETQLDILRNEEGYISSKEFVDLINKIEKFIRNAELTKAIEIADNSLTLVFFNKEKANLLNLRGDAYGHLAKGIDKEEEDEEKDWNVAKTIDEVVVDEVVESVGEETAEDKKEVVESVGEEEAVEVVFIDKSKRIYEESVKLVGSDLNSLDFVTTCLENSDVTEIDVCSLKALDFELSKSEEFTEVGLDNLKQGDIVFLGSGCDSGYGAVAVFSDYSGDRNYFNVYTGSLGGFFNSAQKIKLEFETVLNDNLKHIYRVYRYSGHLNEEGKKNLNAGRKRWTKESALVEIERLLKIRKDGGTYSQNKEFISELVADYVLSEEECKDVRGTGWLFWRFGQKNMESLRTMLGGSEEVIESEEERKIPNKIYESAFKLEGTIATPLKIVLDSLTNTGLQLFSPISPPKYIKEIMSIIDKNSNFVEIGLNEEFEKGDILFLKEECGGDSLAIASGYEGDKVAFYSSFEKKYEVGEFVTRDFYSISKMPYIYRAYRYSGDLSDEEKNSIKTNIPRKTFDDLDDIISQAEQLKGKYSDNKFFVDKLVFDGILNEEECNDITGVGLFNLQESMKDIVKILKLKQVREVAGGAH